MVGERQEGVQALRWTRSVLDTTIAERLKLTMLSFNVSSPFMYQYDRDNLTTFKICNALFAHPPAEPRSNVRSALPRLYETSHHSTNFVSRQTADFLS